MSGGGAGHPIEHWAGGLDGHLAATGKALASVRSRRGAPGSGRLTWAMGCRSARRCSRLQAHVQPQTRPAAAAAAAAAAAVDTRCGQLHELLWSSRVYGASLGPGTISAGPGEVGLATYTADWQGQDARLACPERAMPVCVQGQPGVAVACMVAHDLQQPLEVLPASVLQLSRCTGPDR